MQINVIKNAKRNIIFGTINRVIVMVLPFFERTAIQLILGSQYLGLGSLFNSIITMLSLSELGFSTAMVYNMYKPAAEGNVKKLNALLNYYKKAYRIIGFAILGIGLLLTPFLPHLIKGAHPDDINLTTLYLIYLSNTALSYFLFAYLNSVVVVHQREDIRSTINSGVKIGLTLCQIGVLLATHNYYYYAVLMPAFTIVNNLWLAWRVKKLFPQYKAEGHVTAEDRGSIRKLVAGTFVQQACNVTRNSLDSVCISAFLGLTLTAIYNNYFLIIWGVTAFVSIIATSFMGGVGNHVVTKSVEENYDEMKKLDFVYLWISGWCTICLLCLYQPFMNLWMGKEMMLPFSVVVLYCVYFYLLKMGDIRSTYSSANGLWWEQRYRAVGETVLNLVLNITLGKRFGVHGIIMATIISLFLCNYLWSVSITFNLYFGKERQKQYYLYQFRQTVAVVVTGTLTYLLCTLLPFSHPLEQLAARGLLCVVVPNLCYLAAFRKTEEFQYTKRLLLRRGAGS